jgi:hypothetical protein
MAYTPDQAAQIVAKRDAEIDRLREKLNAMEKDRDAWRGMVGQITSAIPVQDIVGASGTLGDLVKYLKDNLRSPNKP